MSWREELSCIVLGAMTALTISVLVCVGCMSRAIAQETTSHNQISQLPLSKHSKI